MPPDAGNLRSGFVEFLKTVEKEGVIEGAIYQFSDPIVLGALLNLLRKQKIKLHLVTERDYFRDPNIYTTYNEVLLSKLKDEDVTIEYFLKYFDQALFHPTLTRAILERKGHVFRTKEGQNTKLFEVFQGARKIVVEKMDAEEWNSVRKELVNEVHHLEYIHAFYLLQKYGAKVVPDSNPGVLSHNKYFIVDKKRVWVGSYNLTTRCALRNPNQAVWIESPVAAEVFRKDFLQMFEENKFQKSKKRVSEDFPRIVELEGGDKIEIYFSPVDDVEWRIAELLSKAQNSIFFSAFSFSKVDLANLMINKFRGKNTMPAFIRKTVDNGDRKKHEFLIEEGNPVSVKGVYNNLALVDSTFDLLVESKIPVKISSFEGENHNKLIVIDGGSEEGVVITGSYNFSDSSIDNDESTVIIHSAPIAKEYQAYLDQVYLYSRPSYTADRAVYPPDGFLKRETIAMTELMYNPSSTLTNSQDVGEFVELYNYGDKAVDLKGFKICTLSEEEKELKKLVCDELVGFLQNTILWPQTFAMIIDRNLATLQGDYFNKITKGSLVLTTYPESVSLGNGLKENVNVYLFERDAYTLLDLYLGPKKTDPGQSIERKSKPKWQEEVSFEPQEWRLNPDETHSAGQASWN